MAIHGKDTVVLIDGGNLSPYFNSSESTSEADALDKTTYGQKSRRYQAGLLDGSMSFEGFWDGAEDALDQILGGYLGDDDGQVVTLALAGAGFGLPADLMQSKLTSYQVAETVGELIAATAELQADGGVRSGVILFPLATKTATDTGTTLDQLAASTTGAVAHLHVTGAMGSSPTASVKVQHSADGVTWVDLITFAQKTGAGAERKEVAGTVNRYVRAVATIGGTNPSVTLAVAFART